MIGCKALADHERCFEIDAKDFVPLLGRRAAKRACSEKTAALFTIRSNWSYSAVTSCNELCNLRLLGKVRLKEPD